MEKFKILDISGDIGLSAYGEGIKDAFINAALGMYSLITNPDLIEEKKTVEVSVESNLLDGLLVSWLNELIFHFDAYGFIGKKIVIDKLTHSRPSPLTVEGGGETAALYKIEASIAGEEFDSERHEGKLLIKAATYHRLRIEKIDDRWEIDVIFDI